MPRSRLVLNEAGIAGLPLDTGVQRDLRRRADSVLETAQANAPVASGEYKNSLHVEEGPDGALRIAGGTDHDIYVEADTGNLSRALDSAGGS